VLIYNSDFKPNQAQKRAIEHPPAPLMILAGAGTGKTWTLIQRLVYFIKELNIPGENILTITYTEKAAQELSTRILEIIGPKAAGVTVSTFHAFCYNIVKNHVHYNNSIPRLMDTGDVIYLLLNNFESFGSFESKEFPVDPVSAIINSFIPFFNRIRDENIDLSAWNNPEEDEINFSAEKISQLNDLRRIFPIFQKIKKTQNRIDYGDMISICYQLMLTEPEFLQTLSNKYRHLIIDEFQDNNFALNEVMGLIAKNHGSITVVGDDDQIIYSFRGASAYNIKDFRIRYSSFNNYEEIALEENFRTHSQILQVANIIIAKNLERTSKSLKPFENRSGPEPELIWCNKAVQPEFIYHSICKMVEEGTYTYNDMAILCRTRNQVKEMAHALEHAHIPVIAYLIEYFQIPLVRDLMAWCHLIAETRMADTALYRILEHYLDSPELFSLFSRFHKRDSETRLNLILKNFESFSPEIQKQLSLPLELIETMKGENKKEKNSENMVWIICEKTKLLSPYMEAYELQDQIAILNAAQFIEKSQTFSMNHVENSTLKAFVKYMDTLQYAGSISTIYPATSQHRPGVLVQTIHGVKGAEFPVVFIPNNQSGSFPLNFKTEKLLSGPPESWLSYSASTTLSAKENHIQEERRLLYVAVTRAKEKLFILAPEKRTSTFIRHDLPTSLIKEKTVEPKTKSEAKTYSGIRTKYETRLTNALSTEQFKIAKNMILRLERLSEYENNNLLTWGDSTWELEMQAELGGKFIPDRKKQLFLSASALETYHQCPLKYRLKNVDKIPEKTEKPQMVFGNIIHKVLEQFHAEDSVQSQEHLMQLLDKNWDSKDFDYASREENFKTQGRDLLGRYFKFIQNNPPKIAAREYSFSFKIEEITIRGKIDRIDNGSKGFRVIDYKTGKNATLAKNSLQLAIYSIFLNQDQGEYGGRPEFAGLFFLREIEDPLKFHTFTSAELETVKQKILETGKEIQAGKYPHKKGYHCTYCDYKTLLCPAWESGA